MIFGSTAAKFWFPDFREPKDLDVLQKESIMTPNVQSYWYGDSSEFILKNNKHPEYVEAEFLYTIKAAHAHWNIHWDKTMADIIFFQKKWLKIDAELFGLLIKDFTAFHGVRHASLKGKNAKTFFEDAVPRKYIHDSIHEAVAFYERPLYERILKSVGSVECSREKFEELSLQDRQKLVKEEVYVTALERYLVPNGFKYSSWRAYSQSLKKLITTMSSGWFSRFIIENYSQLFKPDSDYVERFKQNQHKLKYEQRDT